MIEAIKKFFWRRQEIKRLYADLFTKQAAVMYSNSTIRDLEFLKNHDEEKRLKLVDEHEALATATEYEKRKQRGEIEKQIEALVIRIKGRDRSAASVRDQIEALKAQQAEIRNKIRVFRENF